MESGGFTINGGVVGGIRLIDLLSKNRIEEADLLPEEFGRMVASDSLNMIYGLLIVASTT